MRRVLFLFLLCLGCVVPEALAHEVRPAYLQIHQTGPESYDVLWKVPAQGEDLRLGIDVELPAGCADVSSTRSAFAAGSFTQRWSVRRSGGLTGATIRIAGLAGTMTDVLVRFERLDGTTQVVRLGPDAPSFIVEATPEPLQVALTYLRLGVGHILSGTDHLLYILAMLFLVQGWRRIIATMTAFTATHSITLTGAALGWVHVPQRPVEACIALSILFVANEIVPGRRDRLTLAQRWPWLISFTFGLLHGFGFAGALSEIGLPQKSIPVALLFFNAGVEIGQLLFVASVLVVFLAAKRLARRLPVPLPGWVRCVPAYAIGSVAAFWVVQRIASF